MITCKRCNLLKEPEEFTRSVHADNGVRDNCKECESDLRLIKKVGFNKIRSQEKYDYAIELSSIKKKAVVAVGAAVKSGDLIRMPCEICSTDKNIHAHHGNYLKPLQVNWLCSLHHKEWHRENGEGLNGYDLKQLQIEVLKVDLKRANREIELLSTAVAVNRIEQEGYVFVKRSEYKENLQKHINKIAKAMDN